MRYTIKFGTYFGIPVRIHFTFPLILLAFGVEAWTRGGWLDALWAVALVAAVFVCVVLHEFGHSLQVMRYGIKVRDIVLLPIGGMARAERIPEKPSQEIIVAISGPLVNFALAALLFAVIWIRQSPFHFEMEFLTNLLWINIVLGVFNLTPAFPMDGGRILRGIFAMRMPYVRATRYAKNVGQVIAIIFVIVGFIYAKLIMLPLIAVFIYFGAISEERMVRVKFSLQDKLAKDFLPVGQAMLIADDPVEAAIPLLDRTSQLALPVTDRLGKLAAAVSVDDLRQAMGQDRRREPLHLFMYTGFPLIDGETPATHAYYMMRSHKLPFAGVLHNDRYLGLIFFDTLAQSIG